MQDQTDPSMEQALAAIKRVMAEDKDQRATRVKPAPPRSSDFAATDPDAVLELDQPLIEENGLPMVDLDDRMIDIPVEEAGDAGGEVAEPLISDNVAELSRARLAELQQAAASAPVAAPSDTNPFEQMVRDMLRPMLKDWLDEHLPRVIEEQVKREIGRITGQRF